MRNLVAAVITGMVFNFNIALIRFLGNLGDLFIFLKKSNYFFFFFFGGKRLSQREPLVLGAVRCGCILLSARNKVESGGLCRDDSVALPLFTLGYVTFVLKTQPTPVIEQLLFHL